MVGKNIFKKLITPVTEGATKLSQSINTLDQKTQNWIKEQDAKKHREDVDKQLEIERKMNAKNKQEVDKNSDLKRAYEFLLNSSSFSEQSKKDLQEFNNLGMFKLKEFIKETKEKGYSFYPRVIFDKKTGQYKEVTEKEIENLIKNSLEQELV